MAAHLEDAPQQVAGLLRLQGGGREWILWPDQPHVDKNSYIIKYVPGCSKLYKTQIKPKPVHPKCMDSSLELPGSGFDLGRVLTSQFGAKPAIRENS